MMHTFASLFKNKETRNKILFTLAMLLIYRIGSAIPVPGINSEALAASIGDNSILNMMNLLGGGALERMSVFAMGVGPYITASIIIQLLSMDVIPALTEMAKSGISRCCTGICPGSLTRIRFRQAVQYPGKLRFIRLYVHSHSAYSGNNVPAVAR